MQWRGKQSQALLDTTRYLDIEGAIRSSKTTIGLWKVYNSCQEHPGIHWLIARWSEDDVNSLIKPLLREMFDRVGLQDAVKWYPDEHRFELPNGSWIYIRGLRPSENQSRFSKLRGLTLGGVLVDQAEEIDEDVALELKGRLSQVGVPHQLIFTPNPPGDDHWLATWFPDTEAGSPPNPNHTYIRLSIFDNAHNLDPGYVEQIQKDYPPGHPMRLRLLEGRRGLNVSGKPVYAGYFRSQEHVVPLDANPAVPLIECVDFGHHHPCVAWLQFQPWGALHLLGGVMGEDMFIEDFAPLITQFRAEWFGACRQTWSCCDPAGTHQNSQGTKLSGIKVLQDNGIYPATVSSANMPEVRTAAIQMVGGYMRRRTVKGDEGFAIDPRRWRVVSNREARHKPFAVLALQAGYVWDERVRRSAGGKAIIVPNKDGYYEHVMNCLEYGVITYGPAKLSPAEERRAQIRQERDASRRDHDPSDWRYGKDPRSMGTMRRGGW